MHRRAATAFAITALVLAACDDGADDTGALEDEIIDLRGQVADLEDTVEAQGARISELELALASLAAEVARLDDASGGNDTSLVQRVEDLEAWTEDALTLFAFVEDLEEVEERVTAAEGDIAGLDARVSALEAKTAPISVQSIAGQPALVVEGVNVFVRNGAGSTDTENGVGNLVVGYDEIRLGEGGVPETMDRSGSHNLVVGDGHDYASYGGLLAGRYNAAEAPFAVVAGGYRNRVTGEAGSVTGGVNNRAEGEASAVTGGTGNVAEGQASTVGGGLNRTVSGNYHWQAGELGPTL